MTNTVSVTNPGSQSNLSGTAITALQISATDTQSGATLTYSATGLPSGLSISSSGRITGTPTAAGSNSVTVTATDGSGYHGSATFNWTITNAVSVTNPGSQSNLSGTAISTLQISATDTQSGATLTYTATGLPIGTLDQLLDRSHHRNADHRRVLYGHGQGHRRVEFLGHGHLQLDHHQHGVGDQSGQPVQRVGHRHQHPPDRCL